MITTLIRLIEREGRASDRAGGRISTSCGLGLRCEGQEKTSFSWDGGFGSRDSAEQKEPSGSFGWGRNRETGVLLQ